MSKHYCISLLICSSLLAPARALEGARVISTVGEIKANLAGLWQILYPGQHLDLNTTVQLKAGSRLSLRYRSDGHREEASGPTTLIVGNTMHNTRVTRYGFSNKALQLPNSGGLDAVGGSISNTGKTIATRGRSDDVQKLQKQAAFNDSPAQSASRNSMLTQAMPQAESMGPDLSLAWTDTAAPSLINNTAVTLSISNIFQGEAVIMDGDAEIARLPINSQKIINLSHLPLQEDTLYLVRLTSQGQDYATQSFRLLNTQERQQLLNLTLQAQVPEKQRLQRLQDFCALGLYHLAAREGKEWLIEQEQPNPYLLQVVYDLNCGILGDTQQVKYWEQWANNNQLPLAR